MIRKAFKMKVYPETMDMYIQRHNPIWEKLKTTLKAHGVHHYSIFLNVETHALFAYVLLESEEKWNAIAQTPVCKEWWLSMQDFMETNEDSSPISLELKEIFYLE